MVDGELSWSMKSYDIDSNDAMERWKTKLYEFSTRMCTRITTEVHGEEFGSYRFDGSYMVDKFIAWMHHITKHHQVLSLDTILLGIPAQWWEVHQEPPHEWEAMEDSMREISRPDIDFHRYMCSCE